MNKKFQCPRCQMHFSSKQMLDFHLYKKKKPCRIFADVEVLSDSDLHTKSTQNCGIHTKFPENFTKRSENSRIIPEILPLSRKIPDFPPENSPLSRKIAHFP